jgi:heme oxygenase
VKDARRETSLCVSPFANAQTIAVRGAPVTSTSVAQLLKRHTRPVHERVEAQLRLLDPGLTSRRLRRVIERFFGFWEPNEMQQMKWSSDHPAEALILRCSERRRAALFARDLRILGAGDAALEAVLRAPPIFESLDEAKVLGWLYVTEGATLGGAIITRHLRTVHALTDLRFECFKPYAEGPGAMWRAFTSALEDFTRDDVARTDSVTRAAVATFEALERWLAPLATST